MRREKKKAVIDFDKLEKMVKESQSLVWTNKALMGQEIPKPNGISSGEEVSK